MMRKLICLLVLAMTLVTVDASAQSKTTAKKPATTTAKKSTATTAKKTTTTTAKKPASSTAKKTTTTTTAKKSTTATKSSTTTSKSGTTTKSSSSSTTTTTKPAQSRNYSRSGNSSSSSSSSASSSRSSNSNSKSSSSKNFRSDFKPHYMGEIHVGDALSDPVVATNHVMLGTIQGLSLGKYGDVGIGVDAEMNTGYPKGGDFPIMHVAPYLSMRPAFPITEKFSIGVNLNMGVSIPVLNCGDGADPQFQVEFAPSLRFKSLRFDIGAKVSGGKAMPVARLGLYLSRF